MLTFTVQETVLTRVNCTPVLYGSIYNKIPPPTILTPNHFSSNMQKCFRRYDIFFPCNLSTSLLGG